MPSVPIPVTSSQQGHGGNPSIHTEKAPEIPNQSNVIGDGPSTRRNVLGKDASTLRNVIGKISRNIAKTNTNSLINCKHSTNPLEEKRKEGYMVLDLKHNYFTGQIFMPLDLMLMLQYHV